MARQSDGRAPAARALVLAGLTGLAACADPGTPADPQPPPAAAAARVAANGHGVCGRTPQVRDALVVATNSDSCAAVTADDLARVNLLDLVPRAETDTPIAALRVGDFDGLSGLQYLLLSLNSLRTLPSQVFAGAPGLVVLDLGDNALTNLPAGAFAGLRNLETLALPGNRLANLSGSVLGDTPRLLSLDMSANGIAELPSGLLRNVPNLEQLVLRANNLEAWPSDAIRDLDRLQEVDMLTNKLSQLPRGAFDGHPQLHTILLAYNQLRMLPADVFRNLRALRHLDLTANLLSGLPDGLFSGTGGLEVLRLANNPGVPFRIAVELERTDAEDPAAPGPARVRARTRLGAPFPMAVGLAVSGGRVSATSVRIGGGETVSDEVVATNSAGSSLSISPVAPPIPGALCSGLPCYDGVRTAAGAPLVLANPPTATIAVPAVHLTQATQTLQGQVPLVAGRQALLRVFVRSDSANAFRPAARAIFHRDGSVVHTAALEPPSSGIPQALREGDLRASFNAVVPGHALRPGVEMVVEVDPEQALPLAPGSVRRVPADGRTALDVREVEPLSLTIVPVHYTWSENAQNNGRVADLARRIAGGEPTHLRYLKALLPFGNVDVTARAPYFTWNDTTELGAIGLLEEIQLLRHLEVGGTDRYYHGIFARPKFVHQAGFWEFLGVAFQPGRAGLTRSHIENGELDPEFAQTLAHEIGHNVNLGHAPCGSPLGVTRIFPTSRRPPASGATSLRPGMACATVRPYAIRGPHVVLSPVLDQRLQLPQGNGLSDRERRDDSLGPAGRDAGAVGGRPKRPPSSRSSLRVAGSGQGSADARPLPPRRVRRGRHGLFSFFFAPDEVDHGGRSFLFALPLRPAWRTALQTIAVGSGGVRKSRHGGVRPRRRLHRRDDRSHPKRGSSMARRDSSPTPRPRPAGDRARLASLGFQPPRKGKTRWPTPCRPSPHRSATSVRPPPRRP